MKRRAGERFRWECENTSPFGEATWHGNLSGWERQQEKRILDGALLWWLAEEAETRPEGDGDFSYDSAHADAPQRGLIESRIIQ
jgi:hypothetical protein